MALYQFSAREWREADVAMLLADHEGFEGSHGIQGGGFGRWGKKTRLPPGAGLTLVPGLISQVAHASPGKAAR
jgi:hypothetical protein